jgi:hypothetical protein
VQRDYEALMLAFARAKDEYDDSSVKFYKLAVCNLFKELQLIVGSFWRPLYYTNV